MQFREAKTATDKDRARDDPERQGNEPQQTRNATTMRVLVTGHRGYVGSVLTCVLRHRRFEVVGLDSDLYAGCDFGRIEESVPGYDMDVRDIEFTDLLSFDAVVHLAGLTDDACCELAPRLTEEINVEATLRLARCCKEAGVSRFVYASSASVYGCCNRCETTEEDPAKPLSNYALSKYICEQELKRMADGYFTPVLLRAATVYGVSPRLRVDTVVNDFVASAAARHHVTMQTPGQAWRPLVHVEDLAQAYAAILLLPDEQVHCQAFNVVRPGENYRVIDIADEVVGLVPFCTRERPEHGFDRRSYRMDGSKLERTCPRLNMRWNLPLGVRQLYNAMTHAGMTPGEWRSERYRRVMRLKGMLERGQLDESLRPMRMLDAQPAPSD
jgi:nucleoside-diphosphate-sugar epimerase